MKHEVLHVWDAGDDSLLLAAHAKHGPRWQIIHETFLPWRTVSSIRNRYARICSVSRRPAVQTCQRCGKKRRGHTCLAVVETTLPTPWPSAHFPVFTVKNWRIDEFAVMMRLGKQ